MILRFFGVAILMCGLFFASIFSLPFLFIWPICPIGPGIWLLFLLLLGLGVYLLAGNRKTGQLVFGLALVFAGMAFLAGNLWDFNLLRFWPALLILWGIVLVLQRRTSK